MSHWWRTGRGPNQRAVCAVPPTHTHTHTHAHTHTLPPRYLRGVKILLLFWRKSYHSVKRGYKWDTILQFYMLGNLFHSHFALSLQSSVFNATTLQTVLHKARDSQAISITFMLSDDRQRSRSTFNEGLACTLSVLFPASLTLSSFPNCCLFPQCILFQ